MCIKSVKRKVFLFYSENGSMMNAQIEILSIIITVALSFSAESFLLAVYSVAKGYGLHFVEIVPAGNMGHLP